MTRFKLDQVGTNPDPDAWERVGLFVEGDTTLPSTVLVAAFHLPPGIAAEFRRQMALLSDVLDVEESVVESAG